LCGRNLNSPCILAINVREYQRSNENGQSRETVTQDEDKQKKNTTQYALDTTIRKQTHIT